MLSVLMTVYEKENAAYFRESLQSIREQTLPADEVVLVKDGELNPSLERVISEFSQELPLVVIGLPKVGRCRALRTGVTACRGDLIAIMDSDDIAVPQRFLIQTQIMNSHLELDIVGGAIAEFEADPMRPCGVRRLPCEHEHILAYAKHRNPINQVSAMFRRDAALRVGNYRRSPGFEDWHLWNRMLLSGSRFMNLEEILVLVRVGNGMVKRRCGLRYIQNEIAFHLDMYKTKFLSRREVLSSLALRIPIRLAPLPVIRTVYVKLLRSPA